MLHASFSHAEECGPRFHPLPLVCIGINRICALVALLRLELLRLELLRLAPHFNETLQPTRSTLVVGIAASAPKRHQRTQRKSSARMSGSPRLTMWRTGRRKREGSL